MAKKTQNRFFRNKSPGIWNWASPSAAPERSRGGGGGARPMGTKSSPGGHFGVEMGVLSGLWRPWVDSPRVETRAKSCWAT